MVVTLAIGAVILFAMICVSWYGWITLPDNARVPVHFGITYNNFVSKRFGLVMYPAGGALVYVLVTAATHTSSATGANTSSYIIVPIMGVMLAVQVGAITVARRL